MSMHPTTIAQVQEAVRASSHLRLRGGGSKTALHAAGQAIPSLDLGGLCGILEYQPEEFTFTALAGTPLKQVEEALAAHHQYLPFDPPLIERGATLGGTVACGLSGPGRYRYGGLGDFLLGLKFIDAQGRLVAGGGKVVKNAAGFDLPKLMVGALGAFGPLVEVTFKVFPRPPATATLRVSYVNVDAALNATARLSAAPVDIMALDLAPDNTSCDLEVRLGGLGEILPVRLERIKGLLNLGPGAGFEILDDDQAHWRGVGEFEWLPSGSALVKVPLVPGAVPALEAALTEAGAARRYSVGANLAWIAWPTGPRGLDDILRAQSLAGLILLGSATRSLRLGAWPENVFLRHVLQALDPQRKFISPGERLLSEES